MDIRSIVSSQLADQPARITCGVISTDKVLSHPGHGTSGSTVESQQLDCSNFMKTFQPHSRSFISSTEHIQQTILIQTQNSRPENSDYHNLIPIWDRTFSHPFLTDGLSSGHFQPLFCRLFLELCWGQLFPVMLEVYFKLFPSLQRGFFKWLKTD